MSANQLALWYLVAAVTFILALRGLSGPQTARRGNVYGMAGMAIALLVTLALVYSHSKSIGPIVVAMVIGGAIGAVVARRVQMTPSDPPRSLIIASEPLTTDFSTWLEAPEYSMLTAELTPEGVEFETRDLDV